MLAPKREIEFRYSNKHIPSCVCNECLREKEEEINCSNCSGMSRLTIGLVCPDCGHNYGE